MWYVHSQNICHIYYHDCGWYDNTKWCDIEKRVYVGMCIDKKYTVLYIILVVHKIDMVTLNIVRLV